jgi:hypothetical protein
LGAVDQALVDRVDQCKRALRAELFGDRRESFQVAKHDRDLLAPALDGVAGGEVFFGEVLGGVGVGLGVVDTTGLFDLL